MKSFEDFLENVFLPLGMVSIIFGLPMLSFVYFRFLAHRERMATIRLGLVPQHAPSMGSTLDFAPGETAQVTLTKGIRLALIGFALTLGITFASFHSTEAGTYWHPGPWLLIGFVPMFIGIAQIVIALISGASIGRHTRAFFTSGLAQPPVGEPQAAYARDLEVPAPPDS